MNGYEVLDFILYFFYAVHGVHVFHHACRDLDREIETHDPQTKTTKVDGPECYRSI